MMGVCKGKKMQPTLLRRKPGAAALALLGLLMVLSCSTPPVKPLTWPSVVGTETRAQYNISGLKLPGTRQELRAQRGDTFMWIPLRDIAALRFTGSLRPDDYRRARLVLQTGEILEVDVYTNCLIEGDTEAGYWNMPLSQVSWIEFGRN